jgi:hypothetical protein
MWGQKTKSLRQGVSKEKRDEKEGRRQNSGGRFDELPLATRSCHVSCASQLLSLASTLSGRQGRSLPAPLPDFPPHQLSICMSSDSNLGKSNFLHQLDECLGDNAPVEIGFSASREIVKPSVAAS